MDQTKLFLEISRQKYEQLGPNKKALSRKVDEKSKAKGKDVMTEECTTMLSEIANFKSYLVKIRPAYLSNTKKLGSQDTLTDKEREEIDYNTRMIIQRQLSSLEHLEKLESQRIKEKDSKSSFRLFNNPKSELLEHTIRQHRQGMFMCLKDRLKEVSDLQASQQHIRLSRQLEKAKSTLHHIPANSQPVSRSTSTVPFHELDHQPTVPDKEEQEFEQQLPPELLQELQSENNALLDELEMSLEKAKSAEKSMNEISQLQTTLAANLSVQADKIQSLMDNAFNTTTDVTLGNKELDSTRQRNRKASLAIIYGSCIIALLLLVTDYMR